MYKIKRKFYKKSLKTRNKDKKSKIRNFWCHTPLISEIGRQRQISEFDTSLVYRASSRPAGLHRETMPVNTLKNK